MINKQNPMEGFNPVRWAFIVIYLILTIASVFWHSPLAWEIVPIVLVFSIFIAVSLHGKERYGIKNLLIFFIITWFVSHFFEALSIQTGFPFSYYHYDKLAGPRLFQVPLIIMLAYFGTGYASWILSHILLDQYAKRLQGKQIFLIPLIAAFIMVMWDLCMDPLASTVGSLWVWKEAGSYFGVPLQNYFGWFLVVYLIFQLFALYIAKYDLEQTSKINVFSNRFFWLEAVAIYGIQSLTQILEPFSASSHMEIYGPMALITILTMMFVTLLSYLSIKNNSHLKG